MLGFKVQYKTAKKIVPKTVYDVSRELCYDVHRKLHSKFQRGPLLIFECITFE